MLHWHGTFCPRKPWPVAWISGLRKAACVSLADAGCDVFEILAITGHTDMKEVQTYVAAANKKKAAKSAMIKLHGAV